MMRADTDVTDLWAFVRPERESLAADLQAIDEADWSRPSLCPGWSVRDVLAHMTALARMTPGSFFRKLVASGFSPARLQRRDMTVEQGDSPTETLDRFRSIIGRRNHLPGQTTTLLGETLVHAEDIRRPLGIAHSYPLDALAAVAELYQRWNVVAGSKRRIAGLTLQASDTEWRTGAGPIVRGPMLSLLLAMAGRDAVAGDLEGDGVHLLRART
jgi:uncharacterized protein (TIGR03083 family)